MIIIGALSVGWLALITSNARGNLSAVSDGLTALESDLEN